MDYTQKRETGFCLATMFQIQDMFENGKHDIFLKTVKGFINVKKELLLQFWFKKNLKLGIVVLFTFNKMLVKVFIFDFYSGYGPESKKPSLTICDNF